MVAFSSSAASYPKWLSLHAAALHEERQQFIRSIDLKPGSRVLDAGCGEGSFASIFAADPRVDEVVCLDRDELMVAAVEKTASEKMNCLIADVRSCPLQSASFDLVFAANVLEYIESPAQVIRELARLVRPLGRLILKDEDAYRDIALPIDPELETVIRSAWTEILRQRDNRLWQPTAGRLLSRWVVEAGLEIESVDLLSYCRVSPVSPSFRSYIQAAHRNYESEYRRLLSPVDFDNLWRLLGLDDAGESLFDVPGFVFSGFEYVVTIVG